VATGHVSHEDRGRQKQWGPLWGTKMANAPEEQGPGNASGHKPTRPIRRFVSTNSGCAYMMAAALGGWGAGAIVGLIALRSGLATVSSTPDDVTGMTWRLNAFRMLGTFGLIGTVLASVLVFWSVCWRGRGTRD
jgi:hypothetical protein